MRIKNIKITGIRIKEILLMLVMIILCLIYQLKMPGLLLVLCVSAVITCFWDKELRKNEKYERDYGDGIDYLEEMLFSFEKSGKIRQALKDLMDLFDKGDMKDAIEFANEYLDENYNSNSVEVALSYIEDRYPCKEIRNMHGFLAKAEEIGGDVSDSIEILKEGQNLFVNRTLLFREKCKGERKNILVGILAGIVISALLIYFVPDGEALVDSIIYQTGSVILLIVNLIIFFYSYRMTNKNYLIEQREYSDAEIEDKIVRYINNETRVGRNTLKRIIKKEIELAYPEWIMSLCLLMQTNNVEGAIYESKNKAPIVLRPYVEDLIDNIALKPGDPEPYHDFLKEFRNREVDSSMKLLYAVSAGNCSNVKSQLGHLVHQNGLLKDAAIKKEEDRVLAGLYIFFMAPTLMTSVKLILDMSVLLLAFITKLNV